ncbi:MAG: endonuclease III [Ktedonobacterales bacterium]
MPTKPSESERERAAAIVTAVRAAYPDAHCSLDFTTPLDLLVATMLSAQCTDVRVNMVTKSLFKKYPTAQDYAQANPEQFEQDVKQINFYRNKAKNIQAAAQLIVKNHNGLVPTTMDALIALPGVARKTANVVMGNAYGIVEGVVVDTHVGRLSRRLGLTQSDDPVQVEQDLMALLPQTDWLDFSHMLIVHGRTMCQAKRPLCAECMLVALCPTGQATLGAAVPAAIPADAPIVAANEATPATRASRKRV